MKNDKKSSIRPAHRPAPEPERHSRKCDICRHPEREAIEEEFIDWHSPDNIRDAYGLKARSVIYRHAHALGLFRRRRRNLRCALELMIEEAERTTPTVDGIIRAIRAHSRVTCEGRWIEVPKYVVISRGPDMPSLAEPGAPESDLHKAFLIGTPQRLEMAATHTKQTKEVTSNRDNFAPPSDGD